ncbi:hypothetical protein [uncultured Sphingomonas sp.]|nr:hypothetical protein [uncultured Sphingomonas sp.]
MTISTDSDALADRLEALGLPRGSYTVKPHDRLRKVIGPTARATSRISR